ncbi:MAG: hypothetical protein ABIS67_14570 [Candidatus Eisenbacteria bacterium]
MITMGPLTASSDLTAELPRDPAERLDRVAAALASLIGERRRCERLGLEVPLARVDAQLRYWRFVGALIALEAPRGSR